MSSYFGLWAGWAAKCERGKRRDGVAHLFEFVCVCVCVRVRVCVCARACAACPSFFHLHNTVLRKKMIKFVYIVFYIVGI